MMAESVEKPVVVSGDLHRLLSKGPRPPPAGALSASLTLGWRALLKIKHVPFQLFDVTAMPIMLTVMFTFLFGGALAGSPSTYIQFLLPGILVQAMLFITVYTGVGLNTDIGKGVYDRFRSLPIWQSSPVFGALLGDVLRYLVSAGVVLGVGLGLGFRPEAGPLGVLAAVALSLVLAVSVSWIWIVISMKVQSPESVMTTSFLLLFPITFVSNIFVDPSTMPGWLQSVVNANPVTHLVTATRGLMHGQEVAASVAAVLVASLATTAVFAPLSLWMYKKER
ncbi:MAG TPA: ABC transporter permease [Candidatus Thermoplasmatota archaeon]|nr:ABC transporter permease [Candidatus Thermoplasmatota archaeon]